MPSGKLLWTPEPAASRKTGIAGYMKWLRARGLDFEDYSALWKWSVEDLEGFWGSVWKYFDVADVDYPVLAERVMPGARWFEGSELNFAERVFRKKRDGVALVCRTERGTEKEHSWDELRNRTAALASSLRGMGVSQGDRVAALLPNGMEAVVAMLATASVGGVWSSCSPDFGAPSVVDRFSQIGPKVLFASDGYYYGGKWFDRTELVKSVKESIPSVGKVVGVQGRAKSSGIEGSLDWGDVTRGKGEFEFEQVPFEHPLWVLYSSGTTGLPKPIVHSHGGILVELLKALSLHNDVRENDRFFWYTTTGWMMWNYLLGGLLHGATLILYSGSPIYPSIDTLWDMAEETKMTFLGTSAAFLSACARESGDPRTTHGLSALRGVGSTGSPLPPETFEWAYGHVKENLWLASVSGGTDVCTGFVGGCPTLPVYSGEIQCRCLGAKVEAFDESGMPVVGKVGELVVTEPMPSMPIYLWGDTDGRRYAESYFEKYPGVWRHGDWIKITSRGTCIIYGRSDATIKRLGIRIGTSELYRVVEAIPGVVDSAAVDVDRGDGEEEMILFVQLTGGVKLTEELASDIKTKVKSDVSPRHVPDQVVAVPSIPRTLNGKKVEVPLKRILAGASSDQAVNRGSLADPASIDFYVAFAAERLERLKGAGGGGKSH